MDALRDPGDPAERRSAGATATVWRVPWVTLAVAASSAMLWLLLLGGMAWLRG
jgi:hypothetical protein